MYSRSKAALAGFFADPLCKIFGGAGLRTEKNGERRKRGTRSRGCGSRKVWRRRSRKNSREKAIEIGALLRGKWSALGQTGNQVGFTHLRDPFRMKTFPVIV